MRLYHWFCLVTGSVLLLCGCARVDLLNLTIPTSGYSVVKDVPYNAGERQKLDIYIPDQPAEGRPVIVFYYGGSWQEGSKDDYLFIGQAFASKGITTVIANYRLYPEVYFPTFMEDTASAFVWAHNNIRHYGGNPNNLFVVGHSAGAYNAIMLTLDTAYLKSMVGNPQWIRGAIGIAGPYDFLPLTDPKIIDIFSKRELPTTQPIHFARHGVPPMLLLTGDQDSDVDPRNSYHLAKKLTDLGNTVEQRTYAGIAHIGIALALADGFRNKAPVLDDITTFIQLHATYK